MSPLGLTDEQHAALSAYASAARALADATRRAFRTAYEDVHVDTYEPGAEEVLAGLVAKQVRFFVLMVDDPQLWQVDIGSILLRSMTETLINFRIVAKGGDDAARRFRDYSMGHMKAQKLHIEKLIDDGALPPDWEGRVEELQFLVNLDRWEEVIDIDLRPWSKGIRQDAIDHDAKAEYDLFYQPGSAAVHGEWSSLLETVLAPCVDPLHRFHQVPRTHWFEPSSPRILISGFELLDRTYQSWLSVIGKGSAGYVAEAAAFRNAAKTVMSLMLHADHEHGSTKTDDAGARGTA